MRKILSLALWALAGVIAAQAAEPAYEYVPVVREGVEWHNYYDIDNEAEERIDRFPFVFVLSGDSVVDGKTYKKCWVYEGDEVKNHPAHLVALLREENKVVECVTTELDGSRITGIARPTPYLPSEANGRLNLYDFNDKGYCGLYASGEYVGQNQVVVGNHLANQYTWIGNFVEGIGYDPGEGYGHLLDPDYFYHLPTGTFYETPRPKLNYVTEDGEIIYKSEAYVGVIDYDGIDDVTADSQRVGDGRYYDLTGRPVAAPAAPGIYIHNGKKVLVR